MITRERVSSIKNKIKEKELKKDESIVSIASDLKTSVENNNKLIKHLENMVEKGDIKDIKELIKNLKMQPNINVNVEALDKVELLLDELISKVTEQLSSKNEPLNVNWPKEPKEAIPVVLVDKEKREFYNALMTAIGGSVDTSKLATKTLQEQTIDAINNITIEIPPITIDTTGLATDTNQTNGTQKTQIVDAGGEAVTVTGGKLDVNATLDTTGLATDTNQETIIDRIDTLTGHVDTVEQLLADATGNQTGGGQKTQIVDASNNSVSVTDNRLDVNVQATDLDIRPLVNTDVVTAELSATDNAVLDAIEVDTTAIAGTVKTQRASNTDTALNIQSKPVDRFKWSFAKVTSGIDTTYGTIVKTGSGMAVNQTSGNLVITTGTTAYSETIIRSNDSFSGAGVVRYGLTLSQRIAQNNFVVEWVDIVGDGLSMTINSATSITVTKSTHGFTASDVGKGMWIGNISVASCLPQRIVIASIPDADTIAFTVSGFPASGSGTCSLFGYNYHQVIYSGTTATALGTGYTTQRSGWQNTLANATINTTASGHIGILETSRNNDAQFLDQVQASGTSVQTTSRATANQNVPDIETELYLQIRAFNGTSNPASGTTATFAFVDAQMYNPLMVNIGGIQPFGAKNAMPVVHQGTVTVSGTVTSTISAGAATIAKAEDAAHANGDVGVPALSVRTDTAASLSGATNDYQPLITDALGKLWTAGNQVEDTAHTTGDRGTFVLAVRTDTPASTSGTTGDYEALHTDSTGSLWVNTVVPDKDITTHTNYAKKYYTNAGAVTDGIIWSPAAGKRWHIVTMYIQTSADATITLEDDLASGDSVVWAGEIAAKSGVTLSFTERYPLASGEDAADLLITTSAGNVYVTVVGYEV